MTREESIKILSILRGAYPNFYRGVSREEAIATVNLWSSMFSGDEYPIVAAAVKSLIASDLKGFPPVIGQVKEKIRQITQPEQLTPQEAWAMVAKAVSNSIYNSAEEFEKLPEEVKAVVYSPDQLRRWALGSAEDMETVVSSNFQRSFRAKQKTRQDYLSMPDDVKRLMQSYSDRLMLESPIESSCKEGE